MDFLCFRFGRGRPQPALSHCGSHAASPVLLSGATAAGVALLLVPIARWLRRQTADEALRFFNMACFYPLAVFGWLAITVLV